MGNSEAAPKKLEGNEDNVPVPPNGLSNAPMSAQDYFANSAGGLDPATDQGSRCLRGHPLKDFVIPVKGGTCNGCSMAFERGHHAMSCRICNYDLCFSCFAQAVLDVQQALPMVTDGSMLGNDRSPRSPASPKFSVGRPVAKNPLGSTVVTDPSFALDSPEGLKMPPGSEFANGAGLSNDAHGYSGERDELGQRHGDGVQLFADGRRYLGQFLLNTFHGSAIMEWPDGHRYTGQYENNQKSGDGFFLWPDGRFYDGQWRNGQRHGQGQYIAAESYVGEYYEGFRHGDGVLTWPDQKRYAGQFFRGALHGSAMMTWPDGRQYLGQYVDNQKQGEGMFYWPDGRLYEGQWKRGLRHGESRFVDNSGGEFVGSWHKDRLVSSTPAETPGVRDPFCVPPDSLLGRHPTIFETPMDTIAEKEMEPSYSDIIASSRTEAARQEGAGAFSPETRQALSAQDVNVDINLADYEDNGDVAYVTVEGIEHRFLELQDMREMEFEDLREHALELQKSFGHLGDAPVPQNDHGLLGWIYEVHSRHVRPLLDAGITEVKRGRLFKGGVALGPEAVSELGHGAVVAAYTMGSTAQALPSSTRAGVGERKTQGDKRSSEFRTGYGSSGQDFQVLAASAKTMPDGGDDEDNPDEAEKEEAAPETASQPKEAAPEPTPPAQAKAAHRRRERASRLSTSSAGPPEKK
jgi:hypothetical protein